MWICRGFAAAHEGFDGSPEGAEIQSSPYGAI
jgi:hypothetical protein